MIYMAERQKFALWWIRRDLRLLDNQALHAALAAADQVIPLFILDPVLLRSEYASQCRIDFLFAGLASLDADLRARGSRLIVRRGAPLQVLLELQKETNYAALFAEEDFSAYAHSRDAAVAKRFDLHLCGGLTAQHPAVVCKGDGLPYTVFTPYSRVWFERFSPTALLPIPEQIVTPLGIGSEELPQPGAPLREPFATAGEAEAQRRLERFINSAVSRYTDERDRVDLAGTSCLSPYLRFGMLSARQAINTCLNLLSKPDAEAEYPGPNKWLNELIWREFYYAVLYHFPFVQKQSFRPEMRAIPWLNDAQDFTAWQEGRTGYPIVDAGMRQLLATGWMHNRARMIVASFLCKDLLIDWRWGEKFFMQHLLDGDVAANNGGWQWTAGTGTDAAPYFRIFNPTLQAQKFDPHGEYVRRWVPELRDVPDAFIHEPWKFKTAQALEDYPHPIIDHASARQRCLAAYKGQPS